ncbi:MULTISPECIES: FtsK/SpoIIIE family DNA translocase [Clostridia]|uniref:DNA translocase FtsK n=1 Tax=Faecalicatena fissicatena TaxID=290055 RepID=A0ABS2E4M1_9FIRM|nr:MULTISPECIES: DNA translocase FtsK [Clostridia]MBM6736561.1 DNA translocase FtsK [Faecalicatena fissicatena]HIX99796.1 DNA translocase FtsK [Candidatus Dorea intestinigallinarum]
MASRSGTGRRKKKTGRKKTGAQQSFVADEITIWLTLAVSILLLLSAFGLGGAAGSAVSALLSDLFGYSTYLVPFLLFGAVTFLISNRGNRAAYVKTGAALLLFVLITTFLELLLEEGGLLGGAVTGILVPSIGTAGTYVVVVILMIICAVIITGKSAIKGVRERGGQAYGRAREDAARRRELAETRRLIRQQEAKKELEEAKKEAQALEKEEKARGRRKDRHVSGVSFDTTLGEKGKSPEVKELTSPDMEELFAPQEEPSFVINRAQALEEPEAEEAQQPERIEEELPGEPAGDEKKSRRATKMGAEAVAMEAAQVEQMAAQTDAAPKKEYRTPPLSLLTKGKKAGGDSDAHLRETARKLQETLHNFGVNVTITNVSCGPAVTRYELQPEQGVKVSKIVGLTDDIKLNLAAADIRIEAPIPGKAAVGIEVPNKENAVVHLRDLLESGEFKNSSSAIAFAAGRDIAGKPVVADIAKMPHLLVAGATGSGKSVCINTMIISILYKASPEDVKLIMIDPKVVELSVYNGIPHLMIPVVTDPKKAAGALNWAVSEMMKRYELFAKYNVRDIKGFNEKTESMTPEEREGKPGKMPQIVIIVDELADLMMVAPGEVEEAICRLAQLARAAGIHLVVATQRPSVNVITGLIKANMPSRIAFSVTSGVDSRTIIDMNGAEKLLGKGDMLFYPSGYQKPARVQGAFVSDKEVQAVVEYLKKQNGEASYSEEIVSEVNSTASGLGSGSAGESSGDSGGRDAYFAEAGKFIIEKEKASIGMLQRMFRIGFNRAARIMDQLCEAGVVGPEEGTKPRKVLMSMEEFEKYLEENM